MSNDKYLTNALIKAVQKKTLSVAKDVFDRATGESPVYTGLFINSWRAAIDKTDTSTGVMGFVSEPSPPALWPNLTYSTFSLKPVIISNSVDYAKDIQDYGTKRSKPGILQRIVEPYRW